VGCEYSPHLVVTAFGVQKLTPGQHERLLQQNHFETKHVPIQIVIQGLVSPADIIPIASFEPSHLLMLANGTLLRDSESVFASRH